MSTSIDDATMKDVPVPVSASPSPSSDSAMVDTSSSANNSNKRKFDSDESKQSTDTGETNKPASNGSSNEPAEKKIKTENGAAPSSSPVKSTVASAAPAAAAGGAVKSSLPIPKKILPPTAGVAGAAGSGPAPLKAPLPLKTPTPLGKAPAAAASTATSTSAAASKPAVPAASTPSKPVSAPSAGANTPSKLASAGGASSSSSKPSLKKKQFSSSEEESSSEESSSDSDSSDSSDDDAPLKKKKPAAPAKKATPAKKRQASSSDDDSSSDSSDSSGSDSSSSDDSDSSDDDSSDDSSDSDSSDSDAPRKKRKPAKKKKSSGGKNTKYTDTKSAKTKRPKGDGEDSDSDSDDEGVDESKIILYEMDKYDLREVVEPLKETQGANKWWNRRTPAGDKTKWTTLEHNGILFPAEYRPHGIPLVYDGEEFKLTPDQEEVASMWAAMLTTEHVKNPTFAKNFFRDWKTLFPKDSPLKELSKCDFNAMAKHITDQRETEKLVKKTDKAARAREKKEKDLIVETYGYALVDGYKEKVGNFRVEPPNLFRGRGDHPKTGTLKRRVKPEDIIINIGQNVPIPKPPEGHKWKGIIHNNKVTWLAFYRDNVNGDFKYIWLAPSSRFKGESDIKKYEKAQRLKKYIEEIRKNYKKEMESPHSQFRQRATAIYLIDYLALRVGNEKDASEVADTVGCCSLRVEHLKFDPPRTVTFDFLGKDSMRYFNTVELDERAYQNLHSFTKGKKPKDEIFDNLSTTLLNEHLKTLMPDLTAKVFRTYNASITLEKELHNASKDISPTEHATAKVSYYNAANREVAILCNHQRSVPKGHEAAVQKLKDGIDSLKDEVEELEDWIEEMKEGKKVSKADKDGRASREKARTIRRKERMDKSVADAKTKFLKGKEERAKLRAAGKEVESEEEEENYGVKDKSRSKPADVSKAEAALKKLQERLKAHEARMALRDENKEVALGTSKINYMDPRITIAWCKAKEVPLESVFNKSLVTKFPWAMEVPPDWRF